MKSIKIIRTFFLLAILSITVASCTKDEMPALDTPQAARLSFTITDGGYAASDAQNQNIGNMPQTRAVDNGYTTTFTVGDKIGLYMVTPDGGYAAENICLTLVQVDGNLVWQAPDQVELWYEGAMAKYFIYYPYQSAVTGVLNPKAIDATAFFADVVQKWTLATDQSTHALYAAQDLMIGRGTLGDKQSDGTYSLSVPMTHAMALVVVEMPATKYKLKNNANEPLSDYYVPALDTEFYGFRPYLVDGAYRYLVKPSQSQAEPLYGSYTNDSLQTQEYAIQQNSIAAATYVCNTVDGGITEKEHTLEVGDFYMKDGSLLAGSSDELSNEQKSACMGIVYWVGDPTNSTNGDPLMKQEKSHCVHGRVVGLKSAGQVSWSMRHEDISDNWLNNQGGVYLISRLKEENRMQGYANTKALTAYNKSNLYLSQEVIPVDLIDKYAADNSAPTNSSGWYFPSVAEMKSVFWGQGNVQGVQGKNMLNVQLAKLDSPVFDDSPHYWSSTECNGSPCVWAVDSSKGKLLSMSKHDRCVVHAVLAF